MPHRIFALVGPTAVGKTDVSIALARAVNAEIVGCDSMQVYRGMPILTQQPAPEQRAGIPHHLIDCVEPSEPFNVGQYRELALEAIGDIHSRGKAVLLVGGTGLYLKALAEGFCDAPPADVKIREELLAAAEVQGAPALHERLHMVDPVAAAKIHPRDARRLVRALEVYTLTGQPLSQFWKARKTETLPIATVAVTRPREELYARINRRVVHMLEQEGVLEEVTRVMGLALSQTARQVHGLRYLEAYLKGERSLAETVSLWQQQVRQYARRQLTWFRARPHVQWVTLEANQTVDDAVKAILALWAGDAS